MSRLELCSYPVVEVRDGSSTAWSAGVLTVDRAALAAGVVDPAIAALTVEIVRPGDSTRIVHLLDAVEPRVKVAGASCVFPGLLGPPLTAGDGRTHRLPGVLVTTASLLPEPMQGTLAMRDSILDLAGPGSAFSYGSTSWHVVLLPTPAPGATNEEYAAAVRQAGLRTAVALAETTRAAVSETTATLALPPLAGDLPRVACILQVQSQGPQTDTLLYGAPLTELVPTLIHPNELADGALVSANYKSYMRVPTAGYCDHPVVRTLQAAHGGSIDFAGVVLARGHHGSEALKQRSAEYAAKLVRLLGARGVVLAMEGTGNSTLDYLWTVRACERLGVAAVGIAHELTNQDGSGPVFVEAVPEAVSLVSSGNPALLVDIPAVERVVGGEQVAVDGRSWSAQDAQRVGVHTFFASIFQMANSGLRAIDY
jgi:glycine reductase